MWDFMLNRETGDWVFDGNYDYMAVDGNELIRQRIFTRMRIPRGSFIYDTERTLGSRAYLTLAMTLDRAERDLPAIILEALEDMDDIVVNDIQLELDEFDGSISALIKYDNARTQAPQQSDLSRQSLRLTLPIPAAGALPPS